MVVLPVIIQILVGCFHYQQSSYWGTFILGNPHIPLYPIILPLYYITMENHHFLGNSTISITFIGFVHASPCPQASMVLQANSSSSSARASTQCGAEVRMAFITYRSVVTSQRDVDVVNIHWLVVWTPLKNISQLGWLFPIYMAIKNVPNHQPVQWDV